MIIEVEGLRKRYGPRKAVDGVTLSVHEGEFFGVLGPNGAGKSTLVEIVEGLRPADSGSVRVFGRSPWPRDLDLLARLGIQTQSSAFFTRHTAREHLRRVAALHRISRSRADEVLTLVGLDESADTRVEKLSGGQRQRLAIASALTHDPEILFLDEPTAALDPLARKQLWGLLKSLSDRTVIYTTHHLDEAEHLCDRVAILHRGQIVAVDTPSALRERTGAATLEDAYLALVAA
ncbi:ABC transporter ATP-binding protein [Kutzneria sp. NPDC051319]|uniref:ABC transporter ATP-binding protein n=1 Tax=Kutzneria sp. NPDC051319 TaxID=3155047 RepID=UPI00342A1FD1